MHWSLHDLAILAQQASPLAPGGEHLSPPSAGLHEALISIPLAAVLGAALAFRPVRKGTPPRDPAVVQTQIVLACVGAIIMLVVGASLARAFGIVGAASLVRYRAKIGDPKDAAVMLVALAIGLAVGVGIYWVAAVTTVLILAVLYALESFEPAPNKHFVLAISGAGLDDKRDEVERLFRRARIGFDLRATSPNELSYEVQVPARRRTDTLTEAIIRLGLGEETKVEWNTPKK